MGEEMPGVRENALQEDLLLAPQWKQQPEAQPLPFHQGSWERTFVSILHMASDLSLPYRHRDTQTHPPVSSSILKSTQMRRVGCWKKGGRLDTLDTGCFCLYWREGAEQYTFPTSHEAGLAPGKCPSP
jgi:hypothetical protein